VTLAEIVEATGWQKHTVRGFVSILGSEGGQKIESSINAAGERSYHIAKSPATNVCIPTPLRFTPGRRCCVCAGRSGGGAGSRLDQATAYLFDKRELQFSCA
jgi:hypothetical protein